MEVRPVFGKALLRRGSSPDVVLEVPVRTIDIDPDLWASVKDFCHPLIQKWEWIRKPEINVWTPDGIGDLHWVFMKLEALKKGCGATRLVLHKQDVGRTRDYFKRARRSDEFVALNPIVDELRTTPVTAALPKCGYMIDMLGFDYLLDPTKLMEAGQEYDKWLPEVATRYGYSMRWPAPMSLKQRRPVVYFGDRYAEVVWQGTWRDEHWAALTRDLEKLHGVKPVALGLDSDMEKARGVERAGGSFTNLIGKTTLAQALALIRQAPMVVGSVSGLTIVSVALGVRTLILWPDDQSLQSLPPTYMKTWSPPTSELNYMARGFSTGLKRIVSLLRGDQDAVLREGGLDAMGGS